MFWSSPFVSEDLQLWIEECFDWFDENFDAPVGPILPTKAFFQAPSGTSEETARLVVADIKRLLGLTEDVEVFPLDVIPGEYRTDYNALDETGGTFQKVGDVSVIHYDPERLKYPIQFINLMAHELMHVRLSGREAEVPGGAEAHELATDLGCIIAGFGVFQLQAADDAGWMGYLNQNSRAFALALFLQRRKLGAEAVRPYLSSRCNRTLTRAFKHVSLYAET